MNCFNEFVFAAPRRLAMPIAVYPGLTLTEARVCDVVSDPQAQVEAQIALHERYQTPVVISAMDLSAEAEAFGCTLHLSETEIPSVTGRLVTTMEQARQLTVPQPGDKRTAVHLEAVRRLLALPAKPFVLGGCIGPFTLAARLAGVSEALEMTVTEPALIHQLLEKSSTFLIEYIRAFRSAGAAGVIMAEPAAGLLSPRSMSEFSSAYIKNIHAGKPDESFAIILHNCAAKLVHLPAILETGLKTFHFGSPMDLPAALEKVPAAVILCGNLDPTAVFCQLLPDEVLARTAALLATTAGHPHFVLSSGCDLPPNTPMASLDAFYAAAGAAFAIKDCLTVTG
jgi:uroporphyrinogen decarboxylase